MKLIEKALLKKRAGICLTESESNSLTAVLSEGIEDRHSEVNDRIDSLINFFHEQRVDKLVIRDYIESRDRLNQVFAQAHDDDDDHQMDGALSDLVELANEMEQSANGM